MSESFYLCKKCHAESMTGKDHPTDLGCAIRWRTIAAEALTPVMLAKKRIEICAGREHYGSPQLINAKGPTGMCARCVTSAVAAYKMIAKYVGFFRSSQLAAEQEREAENGGKQQAEGISTDQESDLSEDESAHPKEG